MTNLLPAKTTIPVRLFLMDNHDLNIQIAGLLDYGYTPMQISKRLNLDRIQVERIMAENKYTTVQPTTKDTP